MESRPTKTEYGLMIDASLAVTGPFTLLHRMRLDEDVNILYNELTF